MTENEIAQFAARLSAFRATLKDDEKGLLDRMVTQKEGDSDVQAHGYRSIGFELGEDGSYQGRGYKAAFKAGDEDDVEAHGY